jgi:hypothetical protein
MRILKSFNSFYRKNKTANVGLENTTTEWEATETRV